MKERSSSMDGWLSNLISRMFPPVKSIPKFMPWKSIERMPARMMTPETRYHLFLCLVKEILVNGLHSLPVDAIEGDVLQPGNLDDLTQNQACQEQGGKHVGHDSQRKRQGESANGPGPETEQDGSPDDGRQVGIENGPEGASESCFHGSPERLAGSQLIFDSLEYDDVGVGR